MADVEKSPDQLRSCLSRILREVRVRRSILESDIATAQDPQAMARLYLEDLVEFIRHEVEDMAGIQEPENRSDR